MWVSISSQDNMTFLIIYWLCIALMSAAAVIVLLGLALFLKHREIKAFRNVGSGYHGRTVPWPRLTMSGERLSASAPDARMSS